MKVRDKSTVDDKNNEYSNALQEYKAAIMENSQKLKAQFLCALEAKDFAAVKIIFPIIKKKGLITPEEIFSALIPIVRNDENLTITEYLLFQAKTIHSKNNENKEDIPLLHEACLYSSVKTAKFLLNQEFSPTKQAANKDTPLHSAASQSNLQIISLLVNSKADVNAQNSDGQTPLHIATMYNQDKVKKMLIGFKANKRLEANLEGNFKYTYFQIPKLVADKKIEVPPLSLIPEDNSHIKYYQAKANLIKVFFGNKDVNKFLETAVNCFKATVDSFNQQSTDLQNNKQILEDSFTWLGIICKVYKKIDKGENIDLEKYIIENTTRLNQYYSLSMFYTDVCILYLNNHDTPNAIKYGRLAYEIFEKNPFLKKDKLKDFCYILFNLGSSYKVIDSEKANYYFDELKKLKPDDQEVLVRQLQLDILMGNSEEALAKLSLIKDKDHMDLWSILVHLQLGTKPYKDILEAFDFDRFKAEDLKESSSQSYNLYNQICAEIAIENNDYKTAINHHKAIIGSGPKDIMDILVLTLTVYQLKELWSEGLGFLQESYKDYGEVLKKQDYLFFKYYEFLFHEQNGLYDQATVLLKGLQTNFSFAGDIGKKFVEEATLLRFYTDIELKDFEKAKNTLGTLKDLHRDKPDETNVDFKALKHLLNQLEKSVDKIGKISLGEKPADLTTFTLIDCINFTEEEFEKHLSNLTPQQIHSYFQHKKQILAQQKIDEIVKKPLSKWDTGTIHYDSSQENVYPVAGKSDFYAVINPKLLKKLENMGVKVKEQCEKALKNGLSVGGGEGIVFDLREGKNGVVKLWLQGELGDLRLYTNDILVNPQGKCLIVLKHKGNHDKINKVANSPLKTIKTLDNAGENNKQHFSLDNAKYIDQELNPACKVLGDSSDEELDN